MYKTILLSFLCLVLFLLVGCKKDKSDSMIGDGVFPPVPICNYSVDDFTIPAINLDTQFYYDCSYDPGQYYPAPYSYFYPTFNPNNANEIAYLRRDNQNWNNCNHELWTFNFCTGEANYLTDAVCYSLDWSKRGWIAFTDTGRDVRIIKSNGDSLRQLTNTGNYNNSPTWNSEGSRLAFQKIVNVDPFFLISNMEGEIIDTISDMRYTSYFTWSSDNKFSCLAIEDTQLKLAYYDANSNVMNYLNDVYTLGSSFPLDDLNSTVWSLDNNYIYWTGWASLNKTDIATGERTKIWSTVQSTRNFHNLDVSPDGEILIVERRDMEKISECEMNIYENLYLTNIDGTNQRKIVFPE